jgi:chemotaxis family two-component system sensor histidine kinase/response regulator PixL
VTPQLKSNAEPATVLVVDDERIVRDFICVALETAGYNVVCAEHGLEALVRLNRIPPPAAIVLDLFMPEMNGWRFAEHLKQQASFASIPLIVVTGAGPHWGTPVPREQVVLKPFQAASLLTVLQQVVRAA